MHYHVKKTLFFNLIYVKQAHIYRSLSKLSLLDRYEQTKPRLIRTAQVI